MSGNTLICIGVVCIIIGIIGKSSEREERKRFYNSNYHKIKKTTTHSTPHTKSTQEKEVNSPLTTHEKGEAFEKYIVGKLNKKYFKIKEWRSDKFIDGRYAESNKFPDLEIDFQLKGESHIFAIECKWRKSFFKGSIELDQRQVSNYREFANDKSIPVFIALGVGGTPNQPANLFLFNLDKVNGNIFTSQALTLFKKKTTARFFYEYQNKRFR